MGYKMPPRSTFTPVQNHLHFLSLTPPLCFNYASPQISMFDFSSRLKRFNLLFFFPQLQLLICSIIFNKGPARSVSRQYIWIRCKEPCSSSPLCYYIDFQEGVRQYQGMDGICQYAYIIRFHCKGFEVRVEFYCCGWRDIVKMPILII